MVAQTECKNANSKRIAKIIYLLRLKGFTQQKVADELKITRQAVNQVIHGKIRLAKVNNWLKENLGI